MNHKRRLATLLLTGAAATMIVLPNAGTAQAAAEWVNLSIRPLGSGNYSVTVSGHLTLPQAVPAAYSIKIIGEDTWADDTPVCDQWHPGTVTSPMNTDANGNFWHQYTCPGTLLNEDWGQDENYAKVTVFPAGVKSHAVRSNTVTGSY